MSYFLQLWGGLFYLLNKVFFFYSERTLSRAQQRKWRSWAWIVYLIGLPPWIVIFIAERNWIAAAVESSGVPSMLLGLWAARKESTQLQEYRWLDYLAKLMIPVGLGASFLDFGGLVSFHQFLESGIALCFLMGTYSLAKSKPGGYLWLAGGNICAALLMMQQGYTLLMTQQTISLSFVLRAFFIQRKNGNKVI